MPVYTPPQQPGSSGDSIGDVNRAWAWLAEFFNFRSGILYAVREVVRGTIDNIL